MIVHVMIKKCTEKGKKNMAPRYIGQSAVPDASPLDTVEKATVFDEENDKYKFFLKTMHLRDGVIFLTLLSYTDVVLTVIAMLLTVFAPVMATRTSCLGLSIWMIYILPPAITKHCALKWENKWWMIPSLVISFLDFSFFLFAFLLNVVMITVGGTHYYNQSPNIPREYVFLLDMYSWCEMVSWAFFTIIFYWIFEIQLKYFVYLRDKNNFQKQKMGSPTEVNYTNPSGNGTFVAMQARELEATGVVHPYRSYM